MRKFSFQKAQNPKNGIKRISGKIMRRHKSSMRALSPRALMTSSEGEAGLINIARARELQSSYDFAHDSTL